MRIIDADALFDSLIFPNDQWRKTFKELLDDEPTVDPSKFFDGMTNGEVMQTLFPNGKVIECDEAIGYEQMLDDKYSYCSWFDGLWWNAPYQKGGE